MYLRNKKTGEHFCFNQPLMDTGKYEKVESLPKGEQKAEAPTVPLTQPAAQPEKKASSPRAKK